jgi:adenylate kinase
MDAIYLIGPPGSGKSTQGSSLAEHLGAPHLSVGELFRKARSLGHAVPRAPRRSFAGPGVVCDLVLSALSTRKPELIVLDGFPRAAEQVEQLNCLPWRSTAVVRLQAEFGVLLKRMKGRGREGEDIARIMARQHLYLTHEEDLVAALHRARIPCITVIGDGTADEVATRVREATLILNLRPASSGDPDVQAGPPSAESLHGAGADQTG